MVALPTVTYAYFMPGVFFSNRFANYFKKYGNLKMATIPLFDSCGTTHSIAACTKTCQITMSVISCAQYAFQELGG